MENLPVPTKPMMMRTVTEGFLQKWTKWNQLATTLLKSGFLPDSYKTSEQVMAVLLKSQELNVPAMEGLYSIDIIGKRPALRPQLMLALVRRSGELQDIVIDRQSDYVEVTVIRKGQSPFKSRFGDVEAIKMKLIDKDNYIKQKFTMYQWRAISANFRITFPDVIAGMYTPEELGAEVRVTDDGDMEIVPTEQIPATYDSISDALGETIKTRKWENCEAWLNLWKPDIEKLPEVQQGVLSRMYKQARKEFGPKEKVLSEKEISNVGTSGPHNEEPKQNSSESKPESTTDPDI
jgi:hypothetical protein